MRIYIRFTTKDTSSKYITCTIVESKLPLLKPYKYMSLSNILKPYIYIYIIYYIIYRLIAKLFFLIFGYISQLHVYLNFCPFTPSNLVFNSVIKHRMSLCMGKPQFWFLNRSDTNQAVQTQQMARGWKF